MNVSKDYSLLGCDPSRLFGRQAQTFRRFLMLPSSGPSKMSVQYMAYHTTTLQRSQLKSEMSVFTAEGIIWTQTYPCWFVKRLIFHSQAISFKSSFTLSTALNATCHTFLPLSKISWRQAENHRNKGNVLTMVTTMATLHWLWRHAFPLSSSVDHSSASTAFSEWRWFLLR
jgi:hypothetical protein